VAFRMNDGPSRAPLTSWQSEPHTVVAPGLAVTGDASASGARPVPSITAAAAATAARAAHFLMFMVPLLALGLQVAHRRSQAPRGEAGPYPSRARGPAASPTPGAGRRAAG